MNFDGFWQIVTSAQVSTAIVMIAVALVLLTLKIYDKSTPGSGRH